MNIIAVETSTQPGSVAACCCGKIAYERVLPADQKTAESFAPELQRMFRELGWSTAAVDAIAVCEGPGSFTGLRIGVTVAKTFAYSTGASVVAPSTMRVLARQANLQPNEEVWCVLDAQRGEIFASLYRCDGSGKSVFEIEPTRIYSPQELAKKFNSTQFAIGGGLRRVDHELLTGITVRDESTWEITAAALAETGHELFVAGDTVDAWKLVPQYFRKSAAEEKLADL